MFIALYIVKLLILGHPLGRAKAATRCAWAKGEFVPSLAQCSCLNMKVKPSQAQLQFCVGDTLYIYLCIVHLSQVYIHKYVLNMIGDN